MINPTAGRDDRIDALRGLALLGILIVNIQSFVWGGANPAGYLQEDSTALDRALFIITVAFFNMKFMPLFAMLFGAGFSLLLDRLRAVTAAPHAVFRRRMQFLFVFGLLHGLLLYFGDITHMYAVAGMVLLRHADQDVRSLRRSLALWWGGALALAVLLAWGPAGSVLDPIDLAAELEANFAAFTQLSYLGQLPTRASLFTRSQVLSRMDLKKGGYVLATVHRAANTDDLKRMRPSLDALSALSLKVVFPIHPRTRKMLQGWGLSAGLNVLFIEPQGYFDSLMLQENADCILPDFWGDAKRGVLAGCEVHSLCGRKPNGWRPLQWVGIDLQG